MEQEWCIQKVVSIIVVLHLGAKVQQYFCATVPQCFIMECGCNKILIEQFRVKTTLKWTQLSIVLTGLSKCDGNLPDLLRVAKEQQWHLPRSFIYSWDNPWGEANHIDAEMFYWLSNCVCCYHWCKKAMRRINHQKKSVMAYLFFNGPSPASFGWFNHFKAFCINNYYTQFEDQ